MLAHVLYVHVYVLGDHVDFMCSFGLNCRGVVQDVPASSLSSSTPVSIPSSWTGAYNGSLVAFMPSSSVLVQSMVAQFAVDYPVLADRVLTYRDEDEMAAYIDHEQYGKDALHAPLLAGVVLLASDANKWRYVLRLNATASTTSGDMQSMPVTTHATHCTPFATS